DERVDLRRSANTGLQATASRAKEIDPMTHPSVTKASPLFFGLDVGDRVTHLCCVDGERAVVERHRFATTADGVREVFASRPRAKIVLEVGSQSPWMSELLRSFGHDVIVADARRVAQLTRAGRKTDRRDAETLARLLQGMPELLGAVHHRTPGPGGSGGDPCTRSTRAYTYE